MRATLARLRSTRGWGSTLPHVHRSRKSRFDAQGHLPVKLDLFSVSRSEKPRLFMYVQAVSIEFNAWDRSSSSVRELWRQLSSKRVRAMRGRGPPLSLSLLAAPSRAADASQRSCAPPTPSVRSRRTWSTRRPPHARISNSVRGVARAPADANGLRVSLTPCVAHSGRLRFGFPGHLPVHDERHPERHIHARVRLGLRLRRPGEGTRIRAIAGWSVLIIKLRPLTVGLTVAVVRIGHERAQSIAGRGLWVDSGGVGRGLCLLPLLEQCDSRLLRCGRRRRQQPNLDVLR